MKKYKTWEVIKMLEENPRLKFETEIKDINIKQLISVNDFNFLTLKCKGCNDGIDENLSLDNEWTLVQEPVDFMTAIKAYMSGKTISCENIKGQPRTIYKPDMGTAYKLMLDTYNNPISCEEILEERWFIEEE